MVLARLAPKCDCDGAIVVRRSQRSGDPRIHGTGRFGQDLWKFQRAVNECNGDVSTVSQTRLRDRYATGEGAGLIYGTYLEAL
jgi:hypothetical protein